MLANYEKFGFKIKAEHLFEKITTRHTDSVLCGVFVVQSRCRERSPVAGIGKE